MVSVSRLPMGGYAKAITTCAGNRTDDNFIKEKMRYKFFQYPRGVNKGGILNTEICPTISTSSWENNCFLVEIYDGQETDDPTPKSGGGKSRTAV